MPERRRLGAAQQLQPIHILEVSVAEHRLIDQY